MLIQASMPFLSFLRREKFLLQVNFRCDLSSIGSPIQAFCIFRFISHSWWTLNFGDTICSSTPKTNILGPEHLTLSDISFSGFH